MTYKFYIQLCPQKVWSNLRQAMIDVSQSDLLDLEEHFKCKYVKAEGIAENGKVRNIYTESYAETEKLRTFVPEELVYENTEIALTLLFLPETKDEMDIQNNERAFFDFVSGRKVEFHDTFRNRYVTLLLINKPEVVGEVLYGGSRYRQVKYTFKNVYGRSFESSQI